ncbi:MAG: hypothetical protein QXH44_06175 [Pyrobaculum sp.]
MQRLDTTVLIGVGRRRHRPYRRLGATPSPLSNLPRLYKILYLRSETNWRPRLGYRLVKTTFLHYLAELPHGVVRIHFNGD